MLKNTQVIDDQRSRLESLYRSHVSSGSEYALVDFPDHANVGDSAIWVGEIEILKSITGREPVYVSRHDNFDLSQFNKACPEGVLFIHGGGNLGDIWPHHQIFREFLLTHVKGHPIVQLPQSAKFRDESGIKRFAAIVAAHPNFHLYVRDTASLEFANTNLSCKVDLTPDSAIGMGAQKRESPICSTLMLLRTDDEQAGYDFGELESIADAEITDWLIDSPQLLKNKRFRRRAVRLWSRIDSNRMRVRWYNYLANERVNRGLSLLSRGRYVITDRLHGHILCTLLDIPHVALDNDYGKVSGYIASWTKGYEGLTVATSAREAAMAIKTMADQ